MFSKLGKIGLKFMKRHVGKVQKGIIPLFLMSFFLVGEAVFAETKLQTKRQEECQASCEECFSRDLFKLQQEKFIARKKKVAKQKQSGQIQAPGYGARGEYLETGLFATKMRKIHYRYNICKQKQKQKQK